MAYEYTSDMGEISGFGGDYEAMCRKMVIAGMEWWDEHPDADPQFHGFKGIYGIIEEDNDDAKALTKAVVAPSDGGCTGAMHQAAIGHVLFARKNGWAKYQEKMREPEGGNTNG